MDDVHPYMAQRRRLLEAISEAFTEDEEWQGHVVCGFALVVEFAGPDGTRGLGARSSDAVGDSDLTPWAASGMLTYALGEGLFDACEEDEVDDDDTDAD